MEHLEKLAEMTIPQNIYDTRRDWAGFKGVNLLPEIDSGVWAMSTPA